MPESTLPRAQARLRPRHRWQGVGLYMPSQRQPHHQARVSCFCCLADIGCLPAAATLSARTGTVAMAEARDKERSEVLAATATSVVSGMVKSMRSVPVMTPLVTGRGARRATAVVSRRRIHRMRLCQWRRKRCSRTRRCPRPKHFLSH
eukprot:scaffold45526_cov55-Phaeocystis_antarctica.AAC.2